MTDAQVDNEIREDAWMATSYEWFMEICWRGLAQSPTVRKEW